MLEKPEERDVKFEVAESVEDFQHYENLGGVFGEEEYKNILQKVEVATVPNIQSMRQAELIAKTAGIELHNGPGNIDRKVMLYGILRSDPNNQMSDQLLFAEVLKIVGDSESLGKLISTHQNIQF